METLFALDLSLLRLFNGSLSNPLLDQVFLLASLLGMAAAVWIVVAVRLALKPDRRSRLIAAQVGLALVFDLAVIETLVKNAVSRTRPFAALEGVNTVALALYHNARHFTVQLADATHSFPSGHAFSAFAACTILAMYFPRYRGRLYLLAAVVAFSRVYLGVHYPSDIAAGALLGAAVGWIIAAGARRLFGLTTPAVAAGCPCKAR